MNLQTIADRLGVSRSTVSNAWNRPDHVSAALRQRIFEVAAEIGYAGPAPAARTLRTGRHRALGLLFTDSLTHAVRDAAAVRFFEGLALTCEEAEVSLLLIPATETDEGALGMVAQAAVDGVVLYSLPEDSPHLEIAVRRRLPLVVVDSPADVPGADWVGLDDEANVHHLGEYLAQLGHTRVGIVCFRLIGDGFSGPVLPPRLARTAHVVQRARIEGLLAALAEAGVDPAQVPIEETPANERRNGLEAGRALLERHPDLTAIVCTSDVLALGALRAAAERGLRVPEDLSVAGYDGIDEAAEAGLTTIQQPLVEKGRLAGRLLLSAGPDREPRREVLATQLRIRRTTGPARR